MPKIYEPTSEMARIAEDVLELRKTLPPSRRAGTPTGVARARDLKNRRKLDLSTVWRMRQFFRRHGSAPGSARARQDRTSKAAQAWALWGGNPGREFAEAIVREVEERAASLEAQAERYPERREELLKEASRLLREMRK